MGVALASGSREVAGLQSLALLHCALLNGLLGESGTAVPELKEAYSAAGWSEFPFGGGRRRGPGADLRHAG